MKDTTQTKEILHCVANIIKSVDKARADDRRISIPEAIGIAAANLTNVVAAIRDAGEVLEEARDFTDTELDDMYFFFLTEMEWNPTDDNRDLAAAYFELIKDAYTNILRILNTRRPPKGTPVE